MKGGLGNLMKQAQKMQADMQKAQEELANMEVTGQSGGGLVSVQMTGRHDVKRVSIDDSLMGDIRAAFNGPVIANEGLTKEVAEKLLAEDMADAVAFGRDFIATPDLPERFRRNLPLNEQDPSTFYAGGAEGYVDYPIRTGVAAE